MKVKIVGFFAVAAMTAMLAAGTAKAASISFGGYGGPIMIKYGNFDVGRVYGVGVNTPALPGAVGGPLVDLQPQVPANGVPLPGDANPNGNPAEDFWGIAKITDIYAGVNVLAPVLYQSGNPAKQGNIQLTAIFWGGRDIQVTNDPTTGNQQVSSDSVQMAVFASVVGNNADGLDFVDLGPAARANLLGGIPQYPGITDGTLIWTFNSTPGVSLSNPFAEFKSTFSPTLLNTAQVGAVIGDGGMFLEKGANQLGLGTQQGLLANTPNAPDATVQFTVRKGGNGWLTSSDDPLLTTAVPLPSSVYMGFAGLVVLAFGAYRRHKAA